MGKLNLQVDLIDGTDLVKLPQVLLLLLVHDDVDPGDRLAHDPDLGELGGGSAGNLSNPEAAQLGLEVLELFGQLLLLLLTQLGALDFGLQGYKGV